MKHIYIFAIHICRPETHKVTSCITYIHTPLYTYMYRKYIYKERSIHVSTLEFKLPRFSEILGISSENQNNITDKNTGYECRFLGLL